MPQPTTLRGIFPEPKAAPRRNFVKENVRQIKEMQGILQNLPNLRLSSVKLRSDKYRTVPAKVQTRLTRSLSQQDQHEQRDQLGLGPARDSKEIAAPPPKGGNRSYVISKRPKQKLEIRQLRQVEQIDHPRSAYPQQTEDRTSHRGIQTERTDDTNKLYETGVIKYPSPSILTTLKAIKSPIGSRKQQQQQQQQQPTLDHGDTDLGEKVESLELGEDRPDFIKQNMQAVNKLKSNRQATVYDKTKPPPNYQKGVVPKYIQERKDEQSKEFHEDIDCPVGHVLLPEEERKETLRVLRQSYADRIQELNAMPVRSDTLRMQKRKQELEEELKKIDEGIKVFQRPKVFVKINV